MKEIYQKVLDLQEATFSRIDHNEAMVALVYRITQSNHEPLILKICDRPSDYLREVYFLKKFAGLLPVPKMMKLVEPSKELHGAILMECLSGSLLSGDELTESLAHEIGSVLARIHLHCCSGYGDPIQGELESDPRVYFTMKFEEGLEECRHHLPPQLLERCERYFEEHVDLLLSTDGPCVVHRDFRPGNLIVREGKLQGVIDWAGARASFAEEDFCSIEHGEWMATVACKRAFFSGYASVRPVPDYGRLLSFLRLNKAIATIGFLVKRGTWQTSGARLYQHNRQFLDECIEL